MNNPTVSSHWANISLQLFKVLCHIYIDPPLPLPDLIHEEIESYAVTTFQEHLFNQVLTQHYLEDDCDPDLLNIIERIKNSIPEIIEVYFA